MAWGSGCMNEDCELSKCMDPMRLCSRRCRMPRLKLETWKGNMGTASKIVLSSSSSKSMSMGMTSSLAPASLKDWRY